MLNGFDKHGSFHPFGETMDDGIDFDIDEVGEKIGLTAPQTLLLSYMLRDIDMRVHYTNDEKDQANPRLELIMFWDDKVVAHCNLNTLMNETLEGKYLHIDNDQEIEALEKLKARIEKAIEAHKVEIG